jgi:hypothetical protein
VLFRGHSRSWHYTLALELRRDARWIEGRIRFQTELPCRGWFHYALHTSTDAQCWIYPWLNAGYNITPTLGGHSIGLNCPGHIHANLAGIPFIVTRWDDMIGGLGLALRHNYQHDSLAYDRSADGQTMAVGKGHNGGEAPLHGTVQYRPNTLYELIFQIIALPGGFKDLAWAWAEANQFQFDRHRYYSIAEAVNMVTEGRSQAAHHGAVRYVREDVDGIPVRGYRHGSNQNRIAIYRQSPNAYVDYLLYLRTGREIFRERAFEQMEFLLAAQSDQGWFREDWQIGLRDWSYEAVGENGGVIMVLERNGQVVPAVQRTSQKAMHIIDETIAAPDAADRMDRATGRNLRGPRPDYLGMTCLYIHKLARALEQHEGVRQSNWDHSLQQCLDWVLRVQSDDGGWPMTVSPDGSIRSDNAPAGRLILALDAIAADRQDQRLDEARELHERWILENCVELQQWWGSHKDTGLMIDYGGLQNFIQYCVQRYERTCEHRYLDLALECTYFNFFEHCPKQLEWLWHYSKGGIMEQGNYVQLDIDNMDNLPCASWFKLAEYTGDKFVRALVDQAVYTAMHTLLDEPSHPWFGSWGQYLVDPADSVGFYDQSPIYGGASKYAGSIVFSVVEDLLALEEAGYSVPESRIQE